MAPRRVAAFAPSPLRRSFDDDIEEEEEEEGADTSFASESSSVPLLPSDSETSDEKSGLEEKLPFARQDLKARTQGEEDERAGRYRNVKAAVMVLVTVLFSSALYYGSFHIPRRAKAATESSSIVEVEEVAYGPLLSTTPSNRSLVEHTADYNILFPKRPVQRDGKVFIEALRRSLPVNTPSSIIFHCRHDDVALCANAYRVVFVGPNMHSPAYTQSKVLDDRRVEVEFTLDADPGEYEVWAWPEHETCDQFNHGEGLPYHQLAVSGSPAPLELVGDSPVDSPSPCTAEDDLTNGRWISKAFLNPEHHSPSSPYYNWLESHYVPRPVKGLADYSSFGYIWAPFTCKPQHRSFDEWIDVVKPERLVVFGDSVMRDLFCQQLNAGEKVCEYQMFGEYEQSDKYMAHPRSDGGISHLHFHWSPLGDAPRLSSFLTSLDTPASHIFFNVALWLTRENPDPAVYVERMKPTLDALVRDVPTAKVVARTSAGMNQAIACYDLWRIQRRVVEPVNKAFLELLATSYPTIRALDVYPIYNDRPEATQDGRHWQRLSATENDRPEEGAVGFALTDVIFEGWWLQE